MTQATLEPANVAGTPLDRYFHICAFFGSREQEYAVLGSYYREGLESNEKALHIVEPEVRAEHRDRLRAMGIDVTRCEARRQLHVVTPAEAYLVDGKFDRERAADAGFSAHCTKAARLSSLLELIESLVSSDARGDSARARRG